MKDTAGHPHYRPAHITCACGATHDTFSTRGDFGVDICSACHPFFTGRQKLIDTEGRVERFTKKFGAQTAAQRKTAASEAKAKKAPAAGAKKTSKPKTTTTA